MKKEIIETGKTVEEAIESACQKLGCARDACEWEILDLPKKGFLGLKNTPARVQVSIEVPDEAPAPPAKSAAPLRKEQPAPVKAAGKPTQPAAPKKDAVKEEQSTAQFAAAEPEVPGEPIELVGHVLTKAEAAKSYLQNVLREMSLTPELNIIAEETGVCIKITGEGLGAIIGRRGETLDSLQYLSGLVANRLEGDYLRITVDCGDYRLKRKATLEALARKLSGQVLKTDISKTLEPMNPFERRIIHSTVSTIEGVSSTSIGEEPNRRVVITSPTARPARSGGSRGGRDRDRGPRRSSGGSGGGYKRDARGGGSRSGDRDRPRRSNSGGSGGGYSRDRDRDGAREYRPAQPSVPPKPPTEAEDKPLYAKIDLE